MTKKIHYLFLMSFLSAASMTGSSSSTGNAQPDDTTIGAAKSVQVAPSQEKRNVPREVSLRQDIRNHPFLFAAAAIADEAIIIFLLIIIGFFHDWDIDVLTLLDVFCLFVIGVIFLGGFSLLAASRSSRWRSESKKEEEFIIPSFSVRLWHSFRFMLLPFLVSMTIKVSLLSSDNSPAWAEPVFDFLCGWFDEDTAGFVGCCGTPLILSLLGYLGIVAYDYFHAQGKREEKKELVATS